MWREHHVEFCSKNDLDVSKRRWTSREDVHLRGVPKTERTLSIIDIAWASRLQYWNKEACGNSGGSDPRVGFFIDCSQ